MSPLVSILMPMRNAEGYVREALSSLLSETALSLEVVVIDDGSTDRSVETVRAMGDARVRIIDGPQAGIAAAFNAGLAEVRGAITMRCDADDRYEPGRIAAQTEWLQAHHGFGAICGGFVMIDTKGRRIRTLAIGSVDEEITRELRDGTTRTHLCTYAIRTALLREIGGCRAYFETAEDIDLQLRIGDATRVWYQAQPVYAYRIHGKSITHQQPDARRVFYEETARAFSAQRKAGDGDALDRGCPPRPPSTAGKASSAAGHTQGMLLGQAWREHRQGRKWQAIKTGWRACCAAPLAWRSWTSFAALIVKR